MPGLRYLVNPNGHAASKIFFSFITIPKNFLLNGRQVRKALKAKTQERNVNETEDVQE